MFWANTRPSSGEINVFLRHLLLAPCIPDSHPHRITSTKCRMNTNISPDNGRIVARNM